MKTASPQPPKIDTSKGLKGQVVRNKATFRPEDIEFKKSAESIKVLPSPALEGDELAAEEAELEADLGEGGKKEKRSRLAEMFRRKEGVSEAEERKNERQRKKMRRAAKREVKFGLAQPRLQAMSKVLGSSAPQTQSTMGQRYSPEGSSADNSFNNLINAITMRRSSR